MSFSPMIDKTLYSQVFRPTWKYETQSWFSFLWRLIQINASESFKEIFFFQHVIINRYSCEVSNFCENSFISPRIALFLNFWTKIGFFPSWICPKITQSPIKIFGAASSAIFVLSTRLYFLWNWTLKKMLVRWDLFSNSDYLWHAFLGTETFTTV